MSQIPTTQDTSISTSSDSSKKGRGRPPKVLSDVKEEKAAPVDEGTIDVEQALRVAEKAPANHEEHMRLAAKLTRLESDIVSAQQAKYEWFEVEPEVLRHFCRGELPACGYFIYKNIKLCLAGTAKDIAERDGLNCFQIVFPKDSYTKVGVKSGAE